MHHARQQTAGSMDYQLVQRRILIGLAAPEHVGKLIILNAAEAAFHDFQQTRAGAGIERIPGYFGVDVDDRVEADVLFDGGGLT